MMTRTSHSTVNFQRPFRLEGMDAVAPAGSYKVDLEEERLDTLTIEAWRQTAVILQIATAGVTEYVTVDPQELRDAIVRDRSDAVDPTQRQETRQTLRLRRQ